MGDSNDDMEAYSGFCEDILECEITNILEKIANCELKDFNDQNHMVNYMKKLARIALEKTYENE